VVNLGHWRCDELGAWTAAWSGLSPGDGISEGVAHEELTRAEVDIHCNDRGLVPKLDETRPQHSAARTGTATGYRASLKLRLSRAIGR
jgi:hypothetical protein